MDLKDIQELIKFVAKSGATEVELEIDNVKISIKSPAKKRRGVSDEITAVIQQPTTQPSIVQQAPIMQQTPIIQQAPIIQQNQDEASLNEQQSPSDKEKLNAESSNNYITVKASMIGTFYRSASPENPPFINIGDTIQKGDTLCIIEAMKLFNEIESEVSGTVIKVLVDDASPIEFDQPLFLIDPS